MRNWITIVEGSFHPSTYWFNPKTNEVISAGDHGDEVMSHPDKFGIDWQTVSHMEDAYPFGSDDEEETDHDTPEERDAWIETLPQPPEEVGGSRQGLSRNDAWEQLGMNAGWVRVGHAVKLTSGNTASYFSASTPQAIWKAVRYAAKQGGVADKIEIELCPGFHHRGKLEYLSGDQLDQYMKNGRNGQVFGNADESDSYRVK